MLAEPLIPPPDAVRERLARAERECDLLRSLLRLSHKAAEAEVEHRRAYPEPQGPAVLRGSLRAAGPELTAGGQAAE